METFAFVARSFSPWTCLLALASTACLVVAMLAVRRSRHLSRELEQHRTHAQMLEMAHEQVQREAEHKEHLTAYLAHETNNLIMAVQGSHALMASDAQRAAEIRATEAVDSSANALSALLQVTRDHAQASAGQFEPCLRRLDLQSLILRIAREFEPMAWHKKLALAAEAAPLPLFVTNDEIRVGQIVRTLVANAIKYTRAGGILLRAFRVDEQGARNHSRAGGQRRRPWACFVARSRGAAGGRSASSHLGRHGLRVHAGAARLLVRTGPA